MTTLLELITSTTRRLQYSEVEIIYIVIHWPLENGTNLGKNFFLSHTGRKPNFSDEPISCKVFTNNSPTWNFYNAATQVGLGKTNNIAVEYKIFALCLLVALLRQKSRWAPLHVKNLLKNNNISDSILPFSSCRFNWSTESCRRCGTFKVSFTVAQRRLIVWSRRSLLLPELSQHRIDDPTDSTLQYIWRNWEGFTRSASWTHCKALDGMPPAPVRAAFV